jgi:hypothetical protein
VRDHPEICFLTTAFLILIVAVSLTMDISQGAALAPYVAIIVFIGTLLLILALEEAYSGAWAAFPLTCLAAGLAFAWVSPDHAWFRDSLVGLATGVSGMAIGWRWWHQRAGVVMDGRDEVVGQMPHSVDD